MLLVARRREDHLGELLLSAFVHVIVVPLGPIGCRRRASSSSSSPLRLAKDLPVAECQSRMMTGGLGDFVERGYVGEEDLLVS